MLFEEYKYFDYKFPEPQYLGAKFTHLGWINKFIPNGVNRPDVREVKDYKFIGILSKGQNPVACSSVFKYVKSDNNSKECSISFSFINNRSEYMFRCYFSTNHS